MRKKISNGGAFPMQKHRLLAIFVILILIILVEVLMLRSCNTDSDLSTGTPQMTSSPTTVPATSVPTESPAPTQLPATSAPTLTPVPTEAPATPQPTPDPTATPAPTPTPSYGMEISRGSFSSSTGTAMNMSVNWVAYDDGSGNAVIALTGTVTSYSLQLTSLYDAVTLELAGYSATCNTQSIYLEDSVGQTTSPLFYTKLTVPLGTCADMTVTWKYGGSYSGVDLPTITATGYVYTQ